MSSLDFLLLWDDKARGGDLWKYLRQPKRRSKHRRAQAKSAGLGKIPNRVGIEHRAAEIDERRFIGHWEGDIVIQGAWSRWYRPRKLHGYRTTAQVFLGEYSGALNTAGAALVA